MPTHVHAEVVDIFVFFDNFTLALPHTKADLPSRFARVGVTYYSTIYKGGDLGQQLTSAAVVDGQVALCRHVILPSKLYTLEELPLHHYKLLNT